MPPLIHRNRLSASDVPPWSVFQSAMGQISVNSQSLGFPTLPGKAVEGWGRLCFRFSKRRYGRQTSL